MALKHLYQRSFAFFSPTVELYDTTTSSSGDLNSTFAYDKNSYFLVLEELNSMTNDKRYTPTCHKLTIWFWITPATSFTLSRPPGPPALGELDSAFWKCSLPVQIVLRTRRVSLVYTISQDTHSRYFAGYAHSLGILTNKIRKVSLGILEGHRDSHAFHNLVQVLTLRLRTF